MTDSADVWLTVPAAWDTNCCSIMRSAAITAGLVQVATAGDINWRDRLHIITLVIFFLISLCILLNLLTLGNPKPLPYTLHT